ncbi:helix-turn-helix domain-containing protein [Actinokineospora terrae]|uniref:Transcriptional regulator, contains XRE-family HTH domain n=1 Tax=Actinokineospora terrae TaxID=155974 RepID=A0A1H9MRX4_9PSEU|nr:helix-turn-helix transcriptional regulator [Actinokineospora terrae]SER26388.1 Transcriptional regulator, contains XRE-family HTH domain [Actinokineospora terrae]
MTQTASIGGLLREWRRIRDVSQLALASRTEISTRHLSFVETGRSAPSRAMVLRLAEQLDVPLRDRNRMLLAAGYAPAYPESALDTPRLESVRAAVRRVLTSHNPFPAFVVDGGWDMVDANAAVTLLTEGAPPDLLAPPFNVLRYSLHPRGLAARIVNLTQWRRYVLTRLERQLRAGLVQLTDLHRELLAYPSTNSLADPGDTPTDPFDVVTPLRLRHDGHDLSLFGTVTTFGTPRDITVEELHVENFYPSDEATERYLRSR